MNTIFHIAVHNFGGLKNNPYASTQHLSEAQLENAHRNNWPDFPSKLNGSHIGYPLVIFPQYYKQFRYIGEEAAHIKGRNVDTIGICLAGNFNKRPNGTSVDYPTKYQTETLRLLLGILLEKKYKDYGIRVLPDTDLSLSIGRLWPHRTYQPAGYTECYGNLLDDNWARELMVQYYAHKTSINQQLIRAYASLVEWLSRPAQVLGGGGRECPGMLELEEDIIN